MRSKLLSFVGFGVLFAFAAWVGPSCLSLDTDRACGEGEPPCYQGEVCYEGRCYDRGNLPEGAGDAGEDDDPADADETDDGGGEDRDAADTAPDSPDGDTGSTVDPDGGDTSPDPDGGSATGYCADLESVVGSEGLGGLRELWNRSPGDDPLDGHPGSQCSDNSECNGECEGGYCIHRVFTTSETYPADFGGLRQADCICQLLAEQAGRDGVFQAILSGDGTSMKSRLAFRADWYVMNYSNGRWQVDKAFSEGAPYFNSSVDSGGFVYSEMGDKISNPNMASAWTGWNVSDQQPGDSCSGWTTTDPDGRARVGFPNAPTSDWIDNMTDTCADREESGGRERRIYCIEQ